MSSLRAPIAIVGLALGLLPSCALDNRAVSVADSGVLGPTGPTGSANGEGAAGTSGFTFMEGSAGIGPGGAAGTDGPLAPSQSWTGYVEQYTFASGSTALKLTFSADDHGVALGTIVFGEGTPPAPATDPNVGYPPDLVAALLLQSPFTTGETIDIAEGYAYTFDAGTFDGHRLQFTANLAQLWSGWCALQVSPGPGFGPCYTTESGRLGLTEDLQARMCTVTNYDPSQDLQVDCGKLLLCTGDECSCSTSGCTLNHIDAVFDLFVTGTTISGSVQAPLGAGNLNVHFVKN
jgi:hypothetical protein